MTYFKDVNTLEELRKQYKELLKKYHPDNPQGSTEATQDINAEYDKLFRLLKDKHESNTEQTNNKTSYDDMKYNFEEDEKLREVLQSIIHLSDITIEVCGSWIWVSGNTYPHKEELKQYGLKYASKKKQWYWHSEAFRKKGKKALSMDDIRSYYGSTEVQTEAIKRIKEA
jgi:curved DNA-binding protein CbpA